jgi:hypothetical protein
MKSAFSFLILSVVALTVLVSGARRSDAACAGIPGNTAEFVGQPNDIIFKAGTPAIKYIPHIYVDWHDTLSLGDTDDCGVVAVSDVPGVSVQETYCFAGGCRIGMAAGTRVALQASTPASYFYPYDGPGGYQQGAVPVIYDGVSRNVKGTITFYLMLDDIGVDLKRIASVNVYVLTGNLPQTWFIWTTSPSNILDDSTILNHGLLNGNSSATLFTQHYSTNGTTWNHPIALWYNTATLRWNIRNEDGTPMPAGLSFSVRIDSSAKRVPTAHVNQSHYLIIDDPVSDNNPFATIIVTPFSAGAARMMHPFALRYTAPHWQIDFMDGAPMPASYVFLGFKFQSGFFVKIIGASQYVDDRLSTDASGMVNTSLSNGAGVDLNAIGSGRVVGNTIFLRQFCWTMNATMPLIATMNATALPPPAPRNYNTVEAKYYGVGFSVNAATVFHEDGTKMFGTTPFNVWAPYKSGCAPDPMPHQ